MKSILIAAIIGWMGPASAAPLRVGRAHTHGVARVDVGIDGKNGSVSFEIDTHSLTGFEHPAKTAKEKAEVEKVYKAFRSQIAKMFSFDAKLGCQLQERKLNIASEESGPASAAEGHQSLFGDFNVECLKNISPSKLSVDLKSVFSEIQNIKVNVVTEKGAKSMELPGTGEVVLE